MNIKCDWLEGESSSPEEFEAMVAAAPAAILAHQKRTKQYLVNKTTDWVRTLYATKVCGMTPQQIAENKGTTPKAESLKKKQYKETYAKEHAMYAPNGEHVVDRILEKMSKRNVITVTDVVKMFDDVTAELALAALQAGTARGCFENVTSRADTQQKFKPTGKMFVYDNSLEPLHVLNRRKRCREAIKYAREGESLMIPIKVGKPGIRVIREELMTPRDTDLTCVAVTALDNESKEKSGPPFEGKYAHNFRLLVTFSRHTANNPFAQALDAIDEMENGAHCVPTTGFLTEKALEKFKGKPLAAIEQNIKRVIAKAQKADLGEQVLNDYSICLVYSWTGIDRNSDKPKRKKA